MSVKMVKTPVLQEKLQNFSTPLLQTYSLPGQSLELMLDLGKLKAFLLVLRSLVYKK